MKTTSYKDIRARSITTPEAEQAVAEQRRLLDAEIELHALREQRGVTQTALAAALNVARPRVSRIENDGEDLRLSTVQRYVEALGGQLKISAVFDDGAEIPLRPRAI